MKAEVKLYEPGTKIVRSIEAEPRIYPDTIAGLQKGDDWIVDIGAVTIKATGSDLLTLSAVIRSKLGGGTP